MRLADYLALAIRSLRRSRLRSGLTIAAIVIGATGVTIMLTFVTSVKNYVVQSFVESGQVRQILVSETPNLTYDATGGGGGGGGPFGGGGGGGPSPGHGGVPGSSNAILTADIEKRIALVPHVTGVAATLDVGAGGGGQGIEYLSYGSHNLSVFDLRGVEPNGTFSPILAAGRQLQSSDTSGILLSKSYADGLGFAGRYNRLVGQDVTFHTSAGYTGSGATLPDVLPPQNQCTPQARNQPCGQTSGLPAVQLTASVVGILGSNSGDQTIVAPLAWVVGVFDQAQPIDVQYSQPQFGRGNPGNPGPPEGPGYIRGGWEHEDPAKWVADQGGYQSLIAQVDTTDDIAPVALAIDRLGVSTATGLDALNKQKNAADIIGLILGSLGLVALGIAALGVMNTMVMSILERTREIGVMRALGARRRTIRRLFTFEAATLGFLGGFFGVILGEIFVLVAKPVIDHAVKNVSHPNFSVPIWLVFVVIAGTTLIGFVSGLLPARRAARLDPVEALRYE